MRSEKEIRDYRDALAKCNAQPCGCGGTVHEERCRIAGRMMDDLVKHLTWVLGESDELGARVETWLQRAASIPPGAAS